MAKIAIWPSRLIFLEDLPRELEAHQGELGVTRRASRRLAEQRLAMPCAWRRPRDCVSHTDATVVESLGVSIRYNPPL